MIEKLFLFIIETICCDPSSELSQQDSSDEGSQHICLCIIKKIILNYHHIHVPHLIYSSDLPFSHMYAVKTGILKNLTFAQMQRLIWVFTLH